jgi:hypothetical protein
MPSSTLRYPHNQKRNHSTLTVMLETPDDTREYFSEREEEEYYYIHQRPPSEDSQSATVDFVVDDRVDNPKHKHVHYDEESLPNPSDNKRRQYHPPLQGENKRPSSRYSTADRSQQISQMSTVDYSTQSFEQSRAAIDAAARSGPADNVRVRQIGDTTIMTEHRDPYSFYWQLDQLRKAEEPPPRRIPPTDYVIEEEEIPQETIVLSPDSHDSGVHFESQYSRPHKEEVHHLPAGWERHEDPSGFSYYWHVDSGTIQRDPPVCFHYNFSILPNNPVTIHLPILTMLFWSMLPLFCVEWCAFFFCFV